MPELDRLMRAAEAVDEPGPQLQERLGDALEFLQHHLIPHAMAEEAVLYPTVESAFGAPGATATMTRDHQEVVSLTERLATRAREVNGGSLPVEAARELRHMLYGLHALVSVHFHKEEEVYLPLLDESLTEESAKEMFAKMEHAAGEAKQAANRA